MKEIGTCKDCKWWDEKSKGNYGVCENWNKIDEYDYFIRDGIAVDITYDYGGGCFIKVGPDFGCIHWEDKMTTDKQQAIEDYFRALGYTPYKEMPFGKTWVNKSLSYQKQKETLLTELPDIIDHFPSFKKLVLQKMLGEGYHFYTTSMAYGEPSRFVWLNVSGEKISEYEEEIINNEITLAAVKAATKYLEGEK